MIRALLALSLALLAGCATVTAETSAPTLTVGEHEPTLNGVRMWYRVAGRTEGVPVVFLAGGPGGNHYEFAAIAGPALERRHRMVYFDGRGTGKSERPASGDYRIETLVDDIEALRRHLGVDRIAIVAHSFAAIPALEFAARYPQAAAALVIAGGAWNAPASCRERNDHLAVTAPALHAKLIARGPIADDAICEAGFRIVPPADFERLNDEAMFPIRASMEKQAAAQAASGLKNTRELSTAVFKQGLLRYRFAKQEQVRAPVLVVSGAKDYAAGPKTQRLLAQSLPNGRLIEYPDYGHWMFIDDPDRFARDVGAFLDRAVAE